MSTPYRYTPRAPAAPHPTPISVAAIQGVSRRATRAPTLNPFDKFSQNDFDSWISGITGALRQALGQGVDEVPKRLAETRTEPPERSASELAYNDANVDTETEEEDYFEDSFADIKLRRALNKGKGRDPREGPGLGEGWKKEEPIEIGSGSEEEEDKKDGERLTLSSGGRDCELVEEEEYGDEDHELYEDGEGGEELYEEEDSRDGSPPNASHSGYSAHREEIMRAMQHQYNAREDDQEYDSGAEEQDDGPRHHRQLGSPEIIDLDSDEEEPQLLYHQLSDGEHDEDDRGSSPMGHDDEHDMLDEDDELSSYNIAGAKEIVGECEDGEAQEEPELVESDDEVQPMDEDTSFPPRPGQLLEEDVQELEMRDPLSGPRAHAEDVYSDGDIPLRDGHARDDHHIEDEVEGVDGKDDDDEAADQGEEDDEGSTNEDVKGEEAFLPEQPETHELSPPVQIQDVWEGLQTYPGDYYSGGDYRLEGGQDVVLDRPGPEQQDAEQKIINLDDDDTDLGEPTATLAPFAGAQDSPHSDSRPQPPEALSILEPDVVLQDLPNVLNGYPSAEVAPQESQELVVSEKAFHPVAGSAKLLVDSYADTLDALAVELQDVSATPSRQSPFESDIMDADFDLEYPDVSRQASMSRDTATLQADIPEHDVAVADISGEHVTDQPVLPVESESTAGDVDMEDGAREVEGDEGLTVVELPPSRNEVEHATTEVHNVSAESTAEEAEESDPPAHAAFASDDTEVILREDGRGEDEKMVEIESPLASRPADDGVRPEVPTTEDLYEEQPMEEAPQPQDHAVRVVEAPSEMEEEHRHPKVISTKHHTVTLEEVTDEEDDEPIHAQVAAESIVGGVDESDAETGAVDEEVEIDQQTVTVVEVDSEEDEDHGQDGEDEDAHGEIENDDIEVLSISSSGDFPILPHVEDDGEVWEVDQSEPVAEPGTQAITQDAQASTDTQETGHLTIVEEPVGPPVEEMKVEAEDIIPESENGADLVQSEGNATPPTSVEEIEPVASEQLPDSVVFNASDDKVDGTLSEQGDQPSVCHDEDVANAHEQSLPEPPFADDHILVDETVAEDDDRPADAAVQSSNGDADLKDLDTRTTLEELAASLEPPGSSTESTTVSATDDIQDSRLPSTPAQAHEEKGQDTAADVAKQPSAPELSPQQPLVRETYSTYQVEMIQVTRTGPSSLSSTIEPYPTMLSAPTIGTPVPFFLPDQPLALETEAFPAMLSAPKPPTQEDCAEESQSKDAFTLSNEDKVSSPQPDHTEQIEAVVDQEKEGLNDSHDVQYPPSPQSMDPTPEVEMQIDTKSPRTVRHSSASPSSQNVEGHVAEPSPSGVSTSSPQPPAATDTLVTEVSQMSPEPDLFVQQEEVVPKQKTPSVPTSSTGSAQRPSDVPSSSTAAATASWDVAPESTPPSSTTTAARHSQLTSFKSSTMANSGKRKRDGTSPKKSSRGGTGSAQKSWRKKTSKGKEKQMEEAPLDDEEIIVKPRKRSKLVESNISTAGTGSRPPTSTSAVSTQSGSSASSAARLLQPPSRASSIAASEVSEQTQPSPTTSKPPGFPQTHKGPQGWAHYALVPDSQPQAPSPLLQATSAAQRPFLHAHGKKKVPLQLQQYRTMPMQVIQQHPPPAQQVHAPPPAPLLVVDKAQKKHTRRSSATHAHRITIPPPSPSGSQPPSSPQMENDPQTPTSSQAPHSQGPTPQGLVPKSGTRRTQSMKVASSNTHTPVTRSHCRFHKISLPKEECGPRVYFIVPGCSLTKPNVIEDEEIEDHGDATYEESQRMVEDIETLGFEPYLISVLKSLVGSEIMQQREIYYLPLPGEIIVRHPSSSAVQPAASSSKGRASGAPSSTSISARGIGGDILEDLGISDTNSEHGSSDDSDYKDKRPAPQKPSGRKLKHAGRGGGSRGKPHQPSNKRPRASVPQDALQMDEAEERRDAKKAKMDDTQQSRTAPPS